MTTSTTKLSALQLLLYPAAFVSIPFFVELCLYGPHDYNSMWASSVTVLSCCLGGALLTKYLWNCRDQEKEKILLGLVFAWLIAWRGVAVVYEAAKAVFVPGPEWYAIRHQYHSLWYNDHDTLAYLKYHLLDSDMVGGALLFVLIVGQYIVRHPRAVLMFIDASLNWYGALLFNNKDDDFLKEWDFKASRYSQCDDQCASDRDELEDSGTSGFAGRGILTKLAYILFVLIAYVLLFRPGR